MTYRADGYSENERERWANCENMENALHVDVRFWGGSIAQGVRKANSQW